MYALSFYCKHWTRLGMHDSGKHSSLLPKFVNYGCKKCYNFVPLSHSYKTFYDRNLQMSTISQSVCPWHAFSTLSNVCGYGQEPTLKLRCFNRVGTDLTRKRWTWLERLASEKHSSLSRSFVNYSSKNFKSVDQGVDRISLFCNKFTLSLSLCKLSPIKIVTLFLLL